MRFPKKKKKKINNNFNVNKTTLQLLKISNICNISTKKVTLIFFQFEFLHNNSKMNSVYRKIVADSLQNDIP